MLIFLILSLCLELEERCCSVRWKTRAVLRSYIARYSGAPGMGGTSKLFIMVW